MVLPEDVFPGQEDFIVDAQSGMVSVVGKGIFKSKKTGKSGRNSSNIASVSSTTVARLDTGRYGRIR